MSATALDIDIESIEDLDFDARCEHSQHENRHEDQPAKYIVRSWCDECLDVTVYLMCESGWGLLKTFFNLRCRECGNSGDGVGVNIIDTLRD